MKKQEFEDLPRLYDDGNNVVYDVRDSEHSFLNKKSTEYVLDDDIIFGKDCPTFFMDYNLFYVLTALLDEPDLDYVLSDVEFKGNYVTDNLVKQVIFDGEYITKMSIVNVDDFEVMVNNMSPSELSDLLKSNGINAFGKKKKLIKLVLDKISPNSLSTSYELTSNGYDFLKKYGWIKSYDDFLKGFDFDDFSMFFSQREGGDVSKVIIDYLDEHINVANKKQNFTYLNDCYSAKYKVYFSIKDYYSALSQAINRFILRINPVFDFEEDIVDYGVFNSSLIDNISSVLSEADFDLKHEFDKLWDETDIKKEIISKDDAFTYLEEAMESENYEAMSYDYVCKYLPDFKEEMDRNETDILIDMVHNFCESISFYKLIPATDKLIDRLLKEEVNLFDYGNNEDIMGTLIYAICEINSVFDKKDEIISKDDFNKHFKSDLSLIADNAEKIIDLVNSDKSRDVYLFENYDDYDYSPNPILSLSDSIFNEATFLFLKGEVDDAMDVLDRVEKYDSRFATANVLKSLFISNNEEMMKFREMFFDGIIKTGDEFVDYSIDNLDSPEELFERGMYFYDNDVYDNALRLFDASLDISPNQNEVLYYKSASQEYLGDYGEALKSIDKAIRLNPNDENNWIQKAEVLARLNKFKTAEKTFKKAIAIKPSSHHCWVALGKFYYEWKKYDKGIEYLSKAHEIAPDDLEVLLPFIIVAISAEDYKLAGELLDNAESIDPLNPDFLALKGSYILEKGGSVTKAMEYVDRALSIDANNTQAIMLKFNLLSTYDMDAAKEFLEEIAKNNPEILDEVYYSFKQLHLR